jgi:hypothetical protein
MTNMVRAHPWPREAIIDTGKRARKQKLAISVHPESKTVAPEVVIVFIIADWTCSRDPNAKPSAPWSPLLTWDAFGACMRG